MSSQLSGTPKKQTTQKSNNGDNINQNNIPFGWISNAQQFSDIVHEIPLPTFRADSSMNLVNSESFTNTVTLLHAHRQQQQIQEMQRQQQKMQEKQKNKTKQTKQTMFSPLKDQNNVPYPNPTIPLKNSQQLISTLSLMIQNTDVSNVRMRADIQKAQTEPSTLLKAVYNEIPTLKDKDKRAVLSSIINSNSNSKNNHTTTPEKLNYLNNINATDINNKENLKTTINEQQLPQQPQQQQHDQQSLPQQKEVKSKKRTKNAKDHQRQQEEQEIEEKPIQKLFKSLLHFFDEVKEDKDHTVINATFLDNIGKEIQTCAKLGLLKDISLEKYAQLIQFLIRFAKEPNKVSLSYSEKDQHFPVQFERVEFALECCLLVFNLLTMPDISDQLLLLLEDQLIEILSSLKYQVFENIIGHLDPSFKNYVAKPPVDVKEKKSKKRRSNNGEDEEMSNNENEDGDIENESEYDSEEGDNDDSEEEDDDEDDEGEENPYDRKTNKKKSTKTKKKSAPSTTATQRKKNRSNSKMTKFDILSNKVSEILERISCMIEKVQITLSESFISLLLDLCIPTLFIEGINFIQLGSINVVRNSFIKYPNQRQSIIDDILPNLSKPILNNGTIKKIVQRTYKINKEKSIQNLSALLIQLIQGSIYKPSLIDLENYTQPQQPSSKFSLKDAEKYSKTIILFFIQKCSEKTEEGEYRILLENFIQDLLIVLDHPEWPAANLILHLFSVTVMHIVSQQKVDSNFRLVSIDLLGSILTKLKQEMIFSKEDTSLSVIGGSGSGANSNVLASSSSSSSSSSSQSTSSTAPSTLSIDTGKKKLVRCVCNKYDSGSYTIKCNECGSLFHDGCAPDFTNGAIDQQLWICVSCQVKEQVVYYSTISKITPTILEDKVSKKSSSNSKKSKKGRSSKNVNIEDDEESSPSSSSQILTMDSLIINEKEIYQQLILNYLESKCSNESWINTSKQFLIASWLDSTVSGPTTKENLPIRKYFLSQWGLEQINTSEGNSQDLIEDTHSLIKPNNTTTTTTDLFNKSFICNQEDAMKMMRKITISSGSIFQVSNNLLYHLLSILFDPSTKARAKAMKSFTTIIEADPSILADEKVHSAIKNRFMDESISVREHTVDLIGKYVLIKPELTWRYIDLICDLIGDKGISVRKRVVKTLNEICLNHMQHPKIPYLCRVLVTRVNDEEAIKDLVLKTFQDLWFSERFYNSNSINNNNNNNNNNIQQPINPEIIKAKQIIEVSKQLDHQDNWFVDLIQKMLNRSDINISNNNSGAGKKESKKKLEKEHNEIIQMSNKICSTLIEMLVNLDEKKTKNNQEYVGIFKTLYIFCKVNPTFLVPFASILHPYLKPLDPTQLITTEESSIFIYITHILEKTLPLIENNDAQFLRLLESDLVVLIEKQGYSIIQSSIKCLCSIVEKCSFNYTMLESQLSKIYSILTNPQSKPKGELIRTLYVVGLLIRYFDFERRGLTNSALKINIKPGDVINTFIPLASRFFTFVKDKDVVAKSLESVGNIIISSPKILNKDSIKEVLAKSFSPTQTEPKIKETIMKLFYDLLDKETKSLRKPDSSITIDDHDDYGGCSKGGKKREEVNEEDENLEKHLIVSMNVDEDSVSLVSSIQKYFPSMIKFLLEPEESVRLASISTIEMVIRHGILNPLDSVPYIVALLTDPNRYISNLAYKTLVSLNQKHTSSLFKRVTESIKLTFKFHKDLNSKSPFNIVTRGMSKFYLLFKTSKSNRTIFLSNLLTNFESIKEYRYKELSYFVFIFEILASLPYGNMDEVIVVVNAIDKIISLNANFVQSKMNTWLKEENNKKSKATDSEEELEEGNNQQLQLQIKPSYDKVVYKNFIMSMIIVNMLQLKKFILKTYSITKEKMKSYLDGESKDSDKLVTTFTESITFTDHNYPFTTLASESDLQSNSIVQKSIANELKLLLKDDDMDQFSIKPKPSRSSLPSNNNTEDSDTSSSTTTKLTRKRKQSIPKEIKQPPKSKPAAKVSARRKKSKVEPSDEESDD